MSTPEDAATAETSAAPAAAPVGPPPANPFVPVYREPWINPARRGKAAGVGAIALLVALGGGIGIGFAISGDDHRDRPHNGIVVLPGRMGHGPGMYGPLGRIGGYPGYQPEDGAGRATPVPTPSSTG